MEETRVDTARTAQAAEYARVRCCRKKHEEKRLGKEKGTVVNSRSHPFVAVGDAIAFRQSIPLQKESDFLLWGRIRVDLYSTKISWEDEVQCIDRRKLIHISLS